MAIFKYNTTNCSIRIYLKRFWFVMQVKGSAWTQTTFGVCPIKDTSCKHLLELTSGRKFRNALWRHISAVFSHHEMRVKKYEYTECLKKLYCGLSKQTWYNWKEDEDQSYLNWLNKK